MKTQRGDKKKKIGDPYYRFLVIDQNLPESYEAIKFMDKLGLAYTLENVTGYVCRIKLPAVRLKNGKIFQGLKAIKEYGKTAFGPWPSEYMQDEAKIQ